MRACPPQLLLARNALATGWFCLRSQPRQEQVAAENLRRTNQLEVFFPRVRIKRISRGSASWRTEPLFPNYLFAKFDPCLCIARVRHTRGVRDLVRFGSTCIPVPSHAIEELRREFDDSGIKTLSTSVSLGGKVWISEGLFNGLQATVIELLPSRARVKILLEFLGRLSEVEIAESSLLPEIANPLALSRCDAA